MKTLTYAIMMMVVVLFAHTSYAQKSYTVDVDSTVPGLNNRIVYYLSCPALAGVDHEYAGTFDFTSQGWVKHYGDVSGDKKNRRFHFRIETYDASIKMYCASYKSNGNYTDNRPLMRKFKENGFAFRNDDGSLLMGFDLAGGKVYPYQTYKFPIYGERGDSLLRITVNEKTGITTVFGCIAEVPKEGTTLFFTSNVVEWRAFPWTELLGSSGWAAVAFPTSELKEIGRDLASDRENPDPYFRFSFGGTPPGLTGFDNAVWPNLTRCKGFDPVKKNCIIGKFQRE